MKVKSAELKANLSRYLKSVRETKESIEILIREEPVAFLTPIEQKSDIESTEEKKKLLHLKQALAKDGIILSLDDIPTDTKPIPEPVVASDGRTDINTVQELRAEKDW